MNEKYIPKNLDECFIEIDKILNSKDTKELKDGAEEEMCMEHHSMGRHLRNRWGLWQESHLAEWFKEKGIHHADDMSGIIFTSYWRYLNSKPIELDEQIVHYKKYWEEDGNKIR